ncbi:Arm DNA-binding domain-containing protein [Novosphingobium resinovorum]
MGKLTVFHVRAAKNGRHCDGDGLYLMVNGNRARSWVLRIQHQGRRRDIGLGSVDLGRRRQDDPVHAVEILRRKVLTLAEARDKAAILRRLTLAGLDPVAERDREVQRSPTFAQAVDLAHAELSRGGPPSMRPISNRPCSAMPYPHLVATASTLSTTP